MKKQFEQSLRLLHKHGRLFLVVLATLLLVGLLPHWVNAASATAGATFNSPLPKPTHAGDELRDLLHTIIDRDALTAEVLGISVDELKAARESGVRMDELITKLGLDEATVHQELQTAFTQAVEQAVADGKLTQEQANLVLTPPAPRGEQGHQHGPGDRHPGGTPDANATPQPTNATPAATTSATNDTATAAATPSAPERHPHDRRDNPNTQGNQTSNAPASNAPASNAAASNSTASNANSASNPQANNGENGGPRNRSNGNRHGR